MQVLGLASAPVEATASVDADPVAATPSGAVPDAWRTEKIKSIWQALHFSAPPLSTADAITIQQKGGWKEIDPVARASTYFISGRPTLARSPTGMLLVGRGSQYRPHCSVVLIRPDVVLTAAHCVDSRAKDAVLKVYFPFEGFRSSTVGGTEAFCDGRDEGLPSCTDDLAVIRLTEPYRHIIPARIAGTSISTADGVFSAQGFGTSNPILSDRGLLRTGLVEPGECNCGEPDTAMQHSVCFPVHNQRSNEPIEAFANFEGHSGGGMFIQSGSEPLLIGIASKLSRGCGISGAFEGRYVDLRDVRYAEWLASFFDDAQTSNSKREIKWLLRKTYALPGSADASTYPVNIPQKTANLLVTLNHELNGFPPYPDEDLDVEMPESLTADCIRHNGAETCEVQNPPPGDYIIGIKAVRGNPAYQLTAVAILE